MDRPRLKVDGFAMTISDSEMDENLAWPVKTTALLFARFQRGKTDEQLSCQIVANPQELIELPKREWVRAFAGHAGWSAGQLERELSEGSWLVCRPHTAMLEESVPNAMWEAFVGKDQRWRA